MFGRLRTAAIDVLRFVAILAVPSGLLVLGGVFTTWLIKEVPRVEALSAAALCMLAASGIFLWTVRLSPSAVRRDLAYLSAPLFGTALLIAYAESAETFGVIIGTIFGVAMVLDFELRKRKQHR